MNINKFARRAEYIKLAPLFPVGRARIGIFDFTNQIDRVYPGLGIPTLYGVLSILANKSVFYIAGRGVGKTRIINSISSVPNVEASKWDTFTYEELSNYCQPLSNSAGYVGNKHLIFKVEDFSTLSEYHREIFLTVCSKIISDNNFTHTVTKSKYLDIRNCELTLLIAIQPSLYSNLCNKYTQWDSMSYDRFSKFLVLNPLRTTTVNVPVIPTLPRKIRNNSVFDDKKVKLDKVISMYKWQISEGRAFLYAKDYVIALAKFEGANEVTQEHVDKFYEMFHPYLDSFSILQHRKDLGSPIVVKSSSLNLLTEISKSLNITSKKKLAHDLYVSERQIERVAKELINAGLIEKPKPAIYCLSSKLKQYFSWYEDQF